MRSFGLTLVIWLLFHGFETQCVSAALCGGGVLVVLVGIGLYWLYWFVAPCASCASFTSLLVLIRFIVFVRFGMIVGTDGLMACVLAGTWFCLDLSITPVPITR